MECGILWLSKNRDAQKLQFTVYGASLVKKHGPNLSCSFSRKICVLEHPGLLLFWRIYTGTATERSACAGASPLRLLLRSKTTLPKTNSMPTKNPVVRLCVRTCAHRFYHCLTAFEFEVRRFTNSYSFLHTCHLPAYHYVMKREILNSESNVIS